MGLNCFYSLPASVLFCIFDMVLLLLLLLLLLRLLLLLLLPSSRDDDKDDGVVCVCIDFLLTILLHAFLPLLFDDPAKSFALTGATKQTNSN